MTADKPQSYSPSEAELLAEGWERIDVDGFTCVAGPVWRKRFTDGTRLGFIVSPQHCNSHLGTIHGGAVMTLADVGLGAAVSDEMGEDRFRCVTTSLQTQFIAIARIGEFVHCEAELIRRTRQLLFVRGLIKTGERIIASAEGSWSILLSDKT